MTQKPTTASATAPGYADSNASEPTNQGNPTVAVITQPEEVPEELYFSGYASSAATEPPLPWKDGFDHSKFQARWFREDERYRLTGDMRGGYWRLITRAGSMKNFAFCGDMFPDEKDPNCPFDKDGLIGSGPMVQSQSGSPVRECYLAIRPIGAYHAEQKLRGELSAKQLGVDGGEIQDRIAGDIAAASGGSGDVTLLRKDVSMRGNVISSKTWGQIERK